MSKRKNSKTPRQMLDQLDRYLAVGDARAKRLWDILSALRGEDAESWNARIYGANPIRVRAFPKTANSEDMDGSVFFTTMFLRFDADKLPPGHYRRHAEDAWIALQQAKL